MHPFLRGPRSFTPDLVPSIQLGAYLLATLSPTEKVLRFIGMIGMNASFEAISEKVPLAT